MRHFPFFHNWIPFVVHHFYDVSWGGKTSSTKIIYKCACGKLKTKTIYNCGFLTLEEILSPKETK